MKKAAVIIIMFLMAASASAQCAMCRAALENGDGTSKAEAVNDGIVYLMMFPYLAVGIVGYAIYRLRKNSKEKEAK